MILDLIVWNNQTKSYGKIDIDTDQNGYDDDWLEDVVYHRETITNTVNLCITVGGDTCKNDQSRKYTRSKLDFFFLWVKGNEKKHSYGKELMSNLPSTG